LLDEIKPLILKLKNWLATSEYAQRITTKIQGITCKKIQINDEVIKNHAGSVPYIGDALKAQVTNIVAFIETACERFKTMLLNRWNELLKGAEMAKNELEKTEAKEVISEPEKIDGYIYAHQTYQSMKDSQGWTHTALQTINRNIVTQHSEMRQHLQDRHQDMTNDLVEFLERSTNILGNEFNKQNDWLKKILCQIYTQAGATSCDGYGPSLSDLVVEWPEDHNTMWSKMEHLEAQGESIHETMSAIENALTTTVDGRKEGPDDPALLQIGMQVGLDSMEDKISGIEGEIDVFEGNLDSVENRVDAMELKVESIEDNMKEMMNMMLLLVDQSKATANKM
jgi:hypothetical protein